MTHGDALVRGTRLWATAGNSRLLLLYPFFATMLGWLGVALTGSDTILRFVFWHSVALVAIMGVIVLLQAYVFPWMIPAV